MLQYVIMSKKQSIPLEDKVLFRDAVKGTKPLKQDKHQFTTKHVKLFTTNNRKIAATRHRSPFVDRMENIDARDWLNAEDPLHFARCGLQHKLIQRLQRGQIQLDARIDLHEQTIEEAMDSVAQFIEDCIDRKKCWVCIIHGKGHFSKGGKPVLKNFLNQWLPTQRNVLAFHSAKPRHGGTGAVYVLLKGKKCDEK